MLKDITASVNTLREKADAIRGEIDSIEGTEFIVNTMDEYIQELDILAESVQRKCALINVDRTITRLKEIRKWLFGLCKIFLSVAGS